MSEAPEQHEPVRHDAALTSSNTEQPLSPGTPPKRPASDDDIQFVSANPVKKRRLSDQKPALAMAPTQDAMPPPPLPLPLAHTPSPNQHPTPISQPTPAQRFHSLGGVGQAGTPSSSSTPSPAVENRGASSLPVFRNFEFPPSVPSTPSQRPRNSEAISPKQLPQALPTTQPPQPFHPPPEVCVSTSSPSPAPAAAPAPPAQNSVTIDDISCLDVNGVPTNTPGFDASRVFVADGGIMGGLGMNTTGAPASAASVFKPLIGQNVIPFAMYSTGSFVPMAQMHGIPQTPAAFSSLPVPNHSQPHRMMPGNGGMPGFHDHYLSRHHHHHQDAPQTRNTGPDRPSSPTPGSKPPCLHCARIRQEALMRQASLPQTPGYAAAHPHNPTTQQQQYHHHHAPAPPPVNSHHHHHQHHHPLPTPTSQPGPIPRSTPPTPRPPTMAPTPAPPQLPPSTTTTRQQQQQHPFPRPMTPSPPRPNPSTTTTLYPSGNKNNNNPGNNNSNNLLLQDVIQTVHDCFPYAPVAARHGVLPARVAEVLAGVVVAPPPPPPSGGLMRGGGRG